MKKKIYVSELPIIKEWDFIKNVENPSFITYGSHKKVWWKCTKGHEWEATVKNRVLHKSNCPFCTRQKACKNTSLATLKPGIAKEWHSTKNRSLTPNDVTCGSGKKVWWLCDKGHEWCTEVRVRVLGCACPYCSGNKVCIDNCLATLRPDLAAQWHPTKNGKLTSNDVTLGSDKKVWWQCEKGHEWKAVVYSRNGGNECSVCSKGNISRISQKWLDFIGISVENREVLLEDLGFRVDGFGPRTKTVYEFFGDYWHGNPKIYSGGEINPSNKKSFGQLFEDTKARILRLEEAGYKVVYIWENEFLQIKDDIK